jgi:predicted Rossmann-fold nucleotide-binding protein
LAEVNEQIAQTGVPAELSEAKRRAETAVRLARYNKDAVELARRLTAWSKSLTGNHHFIVCSGGSGGVMEQPIAEPRSPAANDRSEYSTAN